MTYRHLGRVATELLHLVKGVNASLDDIAAFHAPGECGELVMRAFKRDCYAALVELEEDTGYTPEELQQELEARVSARWLYHSGLLEVFGAYHERREEEQQARYALRQRQQARLPGGMGPAQLGLQAQKREARRVHRVAP